MIYLIAFLIIIVSYFYGSFSTARIITKSFRSLNIYKIGTGLADTENIYTHISKPMGILVGLLDASKAYLYLLVVEMILHLIEHTHLFTGVAQIYGKNLMLVYGMVMLIGHCLPWTNRFRGGRGIFTYIGMVFYFAPIPTIITMVIAWILVIRFHQIRFAQYLIVIMPVLLMIVLASLIPGFVPNLPTNFMPIMVGTAILMGILNVMVSKKLGEF